jgi:hypothetical protein
VGKSGLSPVNFRGDKVGSADFGDLSVGNWLVVFVAANAKVTHQLNRILIYRVRYAG